MAGLTHDFPCTHCMGAGCQVCQGMGTINLPLWVEYNLAEVMFKCKKCGVDAHMYTPEPGHYIKDLVNTGVMECLNCGAQG